MTFLKSKLQAIAAFIVAIASLVVSVVFIRRADVRATRAELEAKHAVEAADVYRQVRARADGVPDVSTVRAADGVLYEYRNRRGLNSR